MAQMGAVTLIQRFGSELNLYIHFSNGNVSYQLKTPYCDGTTHVVFKQPHKPGCSQHYFQ